MSEMHETHFLLKETKFKFKPIILNEPTRRFVYQEDLEGLNTIQMKFSGTQNVRPIKHFKLSLCPISIKKPQIVPNDCDTRKSVCPIGFFMFSLFPSLPCLGSFIHTRTKNSKEKILQLV